MTDEYPNPPYDVSDTKYLKEACEFLRSGAKTRDEIEEKTDISKPGKVIYLGLQLGFLKEVDEGISATESGVQLSYSSSDEAGLFREATRKYLLYHDLLKALYDNRDSIVREEEYIPRSEIEKHLRVTLKLELSDYKAKAAAKTFLRTLSAANLGEYISGRGGGKPGRIEIESGFFEIISDLLNSSDDDQATSEEKSDSTLSRPEKQDADLPHDPNTISNAVEVQSGVNLDIELSVDGSDDPENVRQLLLSIREGLKQEVNDTLESKEEPINAENNEHSDPEEVDGEQTPQEVEEPADDEESEEDVDGDLSQFTGDS